MDDGTNDELMEMLTATAVLTRYIPYKWGQSAFVNFETALKVGIMVESFVYLLLVLKEKWRDLRRKVAQQLPEMKRIESVLPQSIQSYLVRRRTQKLVAAIGQSKASPDPQKYMLAVVGTLLTSSQDLSGNDCDTLRSASSLGEVEPVGAPQPVAVRGGERRGHPVAEVEVDTAP